MIKKSIQGVSAWMVAGVLGVASVGPVQAAGFGLPSLPSLGGGAAQAGSDVGSQVGAFLKSVQISNELVTRSAVLLLQAVSSKERGAELQKQLDTLGKISDPKEKDAESAKLVASVNAELATQQQSAQTQEGLKQASSSQKVAMGKGLFNLALGMLKLKDAKDSGQGIVAGVGRAPLDAPKVVPVKDALPVLSSLMDNGKAILDSGMALAKTAGIQPKLPTSSGTAPVDAEM